MTRCGVCGGELEGPWVRFHWAPPYIEDLGHYVDAPGASKGSQVKSEPHARGLSDPQWHALRIDSVVPPQRVFRERMSKWLPRWWEWMLAIAPAPWTVAPPPGPIPEKPWGQEDELRYAVMRLLDALGYEAHNLEQGYRNSAAGESSRVSLGLPDLYFRGHGLRGWVETKRWDNVQSPEQVTWMVGELRKGGIYLLVYQVEQIEQWHTLPSQKEQDDDVR